MRLGRIIVFPIKSLDGMELQEAAITPGGILENDRAYAIFDAQDKVVNGKRTARVHDLRCSFDPLVTEVRFWPEGGTPEQFHLGQRAAIDRWLSAFFEMPVHLRHEAKSGFPDDLAAFGPTIVSVASLEAVQAWYPGLSLESVRRRFRSNLELTGGPAFCEDRLFGAPGELRPFQIGPVAFFGHNPCQRCVVPTRDPASGQAVSQFQKHFMEMRRQQLPAWADAARFNHFYRFAVNTSIPPGECRKILRVGDSVAL